MTRTSPNLLDLSTDDPGAPATEDMFGRALTDLMIPTKFRYTTDTPPPARMSLVRSGPLMMAESAAGAFVVEKDSEAADRAAPGLIVNVTLDGGYVVSQDGRTKEMSAGDVMLLHTQAATEVVAPAPQLCRLVFIPETQLAPGLGDIGRFAGLGLSRRYSAVQLLANYVASLDMSAVASESGLGAIISRHLSEILTSTISILADVHDPKEGKGLRAAKLAAVKRTIDASFTSPALNADRVGKTLGVTGRYVQMLMEEEGLTFSSYVLERRLQRAIELLTRNADGAETIASIGAKAGFPDPTHFSRAFRRRFGAPPGRIRFRDPGNS